MLADIQRLLEFDFLRATEIAALNCMQWIGKGDKEAADAAATKANRAAKNDRCCILRYLISRNAPGFGIGVGGDQG